MERSPFDAVVTDSRTWPLGFRGRVPGDVSAEFLVEDGEAQTPWHGIIWAPDFVRTFGNSHLNVYAAYGISMLAA